MHRSTGNINMKRILLTGLLFLAAALFVVLPLEHAFADDSTPTGDDSASTTVSTGDAGSVSNTDNEDNTNLVTTGQPTDQSPSSGASLTDGTDNDQSGNTADATDTPPRGGEVTTDISIADTNNASTTNAADTEASTGDNNANATASTTSGDAPANSSGGTSASITTGNAVASANILNEINTNIVNSNGMFFFLNNLFAPLSTLDFSDFGMSSTSSPCGCNSPGQNT